MDYYLSRDWRHTVMGGLRGPFRLLYFAATFALGSVFALAARAVPPIIAFRRFRAAILQVAVDLGVPVSWATVRYEGPRGWPPARVIVGWEEWPPLVTHIYRAFHAPRIDVVGRVSHPIVYGGD